MKQLQMCIILILCLFIGCSVEAKSVSTSEQAVQVTICVSAHNSNKDAVQKQSKKQIRKAYRRGKIWTTNIDMKYRSKGGKVSTHVSFDKTPQATGYQIGYGKRYDSQTDTIKKMKKKSVKSCSVSFPQAVRYVKVRPYITINHKKYYGSWSSTFTTGYISKDAATR